MADEATVANNLLNFKEISSFNFSKWIYYDIMNINGYIYFRALLYSQYIVSIVGNEVNYAWYIFW